MSNRRGLSFFAQDQFWRFRKVYWGEGGWVCSRVSSALCFLLLDVMSSDTVARYKRVASWWRQHRRQDESSRQSPATNPSTTRFHRRPSHCHLWPFSVLEPCQVKVVDAKTATSDLKSTERSLQHASTFLFFFYFVFEVEEFLWVDLPLARFPFCLVYCPF